MKKTKDINTKNEVLENDVNEKVVKKIKKASPTKQVKEQQDEKIKKTKKVVKKSEEEKEVKTKVTSKTTKTPTKKTKSTSSIVDKKISKNFIPEEESFEDKVFAEEKKRNVYTVKEKINYTPIIIMVGIVLILGLLFFAFKNGFFSITEKKMGDSNIMSEHTVETNMTPEEVNKIISDVESGKTVEDIKEENKETINLSMDNLNKVFPLYDKDIYSEASLNIFDNYTVKRANDEINELLKNDTYIANSTEGQKDILKVNGIFANKYLENYNQSNKDEYDALSKREYYADITTQADKVGDFYHTDFIALTLFGYAKDMGLYYEVPTSLYKKIIINKKAFDGMEINQEGSIKLPVNNDGSLEKTTVKKVDNNYLTFVDKMQKTRKIKLQEKSDTEYYLIDSANGAYMTQLFKSDDKICVLKDARVGHGNNMEYIASNYLRYPNELDYELYVKAEEIVNKTSSNGMLNGQHINSSKQVWDDKGFIVSLVFFEQR